MQTKQVVQLLLYYNKLLLLLFDQRVLNCAFVRVDFFVPSRGLVPLIYMTKRAGPLTELPIFRKAGQSVFLL